MPPRPPPPSHTHTHHTHLPHPPHPHLQEAAEELFDVTAAYFPVSFTPPPNDPHRITRAQLAADLEATLTATPLFAPHLLPLLLEKLGATLR